MDGEQEDDYWTRDTVPDDESMFGSSLDDGFDLPEWDSEFDDFDD